MCHWCTPVTQLADCWQSPGSRPYNAVARGAALWAFGPQRIQLLLTFEIAKVLDRRGRVSAKIFLSIICQSA